MRPGHLEKFVPLPFGLLLRVTPPTDRFDPWLVTIYEDGIEEESIPISQEGIEADDQIAFYAIRTLIMKVFDKGLRRKETEISAAFATLYQDWRRDGVFR